MSVYRERAENLAHDATGVENMLRALVYAVLAVEEAIRDSTDRESLLKEYHRRQAAPWT